MQPEKIGRYEIKSELGRGGMATVYRGYDPRFEREVAVKVLPPELLHADPQFRLRFDREAKIIAQLEHPSIVPVYDVGEENNQPYFVMRYMGGGSLTDRIKANTFTVEQATKILEQIAPGLDEAHTKGIIHRDFKPSNILFDNKGVPYISDFGIAKITQSANTMTGSAIVGTPAYMAPEQAQGTSIDGRADIYALGIILYEMLTGKQPYEADTPMGVAIKHITDPVPHILDANPDLPYDTEEIIQKAMAKDPEDRYATAHEMVEALHEMTRQIAAGKTTAKRTAIKKSPTVPKATATKQKQPEKKSFNVWVVIIPLLVIGIGGGYFLLNGGNLPFGKEPTVTLTNTSIPEATFTLQPTLEPTSTETAIAETFTPAPPTETLEPTIPPLPVVGGADKIAFIKKNDIWIMNVDGSDLRSLTVDHAAKFDLQWLPDGKTLLFISGKTIKTINTETRVEENITSFTSADYFEAFNVSPDGTKVAISLQRELHIVPFDLEQMKNIKKRSDLIALKGCFYDVDLIKAATMDVLWSKDMQKVAIKYLAVAGHAQSETIRVLDIHLCNEGSLPLKMDEFPGIRFAFKTNIMSIDWNGDELFLLNSNERNGGFGNLYLYNTVTHQAYSKLNVVGACCYRDARFSPDGNYVIFAYQDNSILDGPIGLYYIPAGSLTTPGNYKPIENLPEDFFEDGRKESPQPALRPVK